MNSWPEGHKGYLHFQVFNLDRIKVLVGSWHFLVYAEQKKTKN